MNVPPDDMSAVGAFIDLYVESITSVGVVHVDGRCWVNLGGYEFLAFL